MGQDNITSQSNQRIAKNTLILYFRMFLIMGVSLYTSRVILNTLGVTDYGVYNVVGGVITMFTFMNGAMASATQRYLNFDIGKKNFERLAVVFRTSMQIHALIALIVLVLGETIGLWFVSTQLVIPPERVTAAMWVYQFSIITSLVSIVSIPYNADIIAHEKMSAFAYISILDVVLKLLIVYALVVISYDKLIVYGFLYLCVQVLERFVYSIYCSRHFQEVNFSFKIDKPLFKEMASFAGWSLWGNIAAILFTQGINILLNVFFGPAVNAARGIVVQVQGALQGFVANIQLAMNPQITKSYATNDLHRMHHLMFASSKFCFYLLFLVILPLSIEADIVLKTWLGIVPEHTVWFLRLIMFIMLTETLANPYVIANQATGKVKKYQAVCGGLLLCIVPVAYIVLKLGGNPESVFIVHGCIAIITQYARVYMMRNLINVPLRTYFQKVLLPACTVALVSPILPLLLFFNTSVSWHSFITVCLLSVMCVSLCAYYLGMRENERNLVSKKILSVIANKSH